MGKFFLVKDDWEINKFLDWIKCKLVGIILLVDSWIKLLYIIFLIGIFICFLL